MPLFVERCIAPALQSAVHFLFQYTEPSPRIDYKVKAPTSLSCAPPYDRPATPTPGMNLEVNRARYKGGRGGG